MLIFEVRVPGTWLKTEDQEQAWAIQTILFLLEHQFTRAIVALNLFVLERSRRADEGSMRDRWEADAERRRRAEERVRAEVGESAFYADWEEYRERIEREAKREAWADGEWPQAYKHEVAFLHAHSFLYAVDSFGKVLDRLVAAPGSPSGASEAKAEFAEVFPDVSEIRNSALHIEDRGRGKGRGEDDLDLKPLERPGFISAPGGALVLSSLNNDAVGYTLADGTHAELAVSPDNAARLRGIFQDVLESFEWHGPARLLP